jgi:glycolate dehydrogenase FAD-binding subunit
VIATPGHVEVRLEGWPEEVEEQTSIAAGVHEPATVVDDEAFPTSRPWEASPVVVEASVPPSKLSAAVDGDAWQALAGVGIAWVGLDEVAGALETLRGRVREVGGIAPVVRGAGGLGSSPVPALEVHRRLKSAFDPNGVLAPGRGWGGL